MDTIFAYLLENKNETNTNNKIAYAGWFVDEFPKTEFQNDERLMWHFLNFATILEVPAKQKYLENWCEMEMRKIIIEEKIHVTGCEALNYDDPVAFETAFKISKEVLLDDYKVLHDLDISMEDFAPDMAMYMSKKKKERVTEILSRTFNTLSETEDSDKAIDYALGELHLLEDIYDKDKLEDIHYLNVNGDSKHLRKITDTGLPGVDSDCGGIYETQCFGVEAQPGTGKTRFVVGHPAYRAAVLYHKNVAFISLEQDKREIEAMFVARHCFTLFNIVVNDEMILKGTVPPELQQQVEAARIDLFESGKYGNIYITSTNFYVESFVQKLKSMDRLYGPFDLICIDYMGLFESNPGQYKKALDTTDTISAAYKYTKRYVRRTRKAAIVIGQFNREGIAAGLADKTISTDMAQGGINVYRHTDYNIAISMTDEMRAREQRRVSQPKVRGTKGFGTFMCQTKLGVCTYKQMTQKQVS